jgi:ABC-type multidrug transport system fused ATPase/permease subunit
MVGIARKAFALLDRRSQKILFLLVLIQMLLALLDLVGVVLFGLVAALAASAVSGDEPVAIERVLDFFSITSADQIGLAIVLASSAGVIFISKSLLSFLLIRKTYRFLANRQAIISSRLAERLLARPLLEVQMRPSQETAYALTIGVNAATNGILGGAVIIIAEIAVLFVLASALLVINVGVALVTISFFAFIALTLNRALGKWAVNLGARASDTEIESLESVQNAIRTYREVTVSGRRGLIVDRFKSLRWQAASVQANLQIMNQISKYIFEIALVLGGAALALSQGLTQDPIAAVAVIAVFLAAASRVMPSLLRLQQAALGVKASAGIATPTFELSTQLVSLDNEVTRDLDLERKIVSGIRDGFSDFVPSLILRNVTVRYPGANLDTVSDVNIVVNPGDSLALVGATGAGKSTIADLILGILVPDSGEILLGGLPPAVASKSWPGAVAYVPQDITVLKGTVRDNVALGLSIDLVDDERVWDALRRAHLDSVLKAQREGLDTLVGEHGVRMSGGQRQRLGLARALYTNPRLLVMDEATSALDAETESSISDALQELEGEVTLIVIAHRLATIKKLTKVAYIERGSVAAYGTFDFVRQTQPSFDRQAKLLGL